MTTRHDILTSLESAGRPFVTDGGFETSMLFHEGFDLPHFSATPLLLDDTARAAMRSYFDRFLAIAEKTGTGYVLDTNTWRAGSAWTDALGISLDDLMALNMAAVRFAEETRDDWADRVDPILINGVIGPAGDGYSADTCLSPEAAAEIHDAQVKTLTNAGVDLISALTMTHSGEGIGITRAAKAVGCPVVVSYTVETDGRLPTGQTLKDAIAETDAATGSAPLYYMVNCAHPDHFADILDGGWVDRIGGVRANASRLSHAELDAAEELDDGDPAEFGALYGAFRQLLPNLRVIGGCCGTDHRHVDCAAHHLIEKAAA